MKNTHIKNTFIVLLLSFAALLLFAACGGDASSQPLPVEEPQPGTASSQVSSTPQEPQPEPAAEPDTATADTSALDGMLDTIANAAALGDNTIKVDERDLKFGGVNTDNLEGAVGAQAQTASENGGIAIVALAKSGMADTVKQDLETYRDNSLGNEDYADFEDARNNTSQARIVVNGDYVVYAVSAEGDWDGLDAAIASLF